MKYLEFGDPNWKETLEPELQMRKEPLPIYGFKIPEIENNNR